MRGKTKIKRVRKDKSSNCVTGCPPDTSAARTGFSPLGMVSKITCLQIADPRLPGASISPDCTFPFHSGYRMKTKEGPKDMGF